MGQYGTAWKLLGMVENPPYPANCEEAGQCPVCGHRFVFHERVFQADDGRLFDGSFCGERWAQFGPGEQQYLLQSLRRENERRQ